MASVDEYYRQGSRSYWDRNGKYQNPYTPGTYEHDQFERGWIQAQKRDDT